jgi:phosphoribosylaminoimidazole-succinocarboxamide synthase
VAGFAGADAPDLPGWTHAYSGKVRDLYVPVGQDLATAPRILVVASDRISAFDHVLEPVIPNKGELLTRLSTWWFEQLPVPNHLREPDSTTPSIPTEVQSRSMLVANLDMFPIECVVRGYLSGSGWLEYQETQTVCGVPLPSGLRNGDRLPVPVYTPAYKAPVGEHDENITFERTIELIGEADARSLRDLSLDIFTLATHLAAKRGVILADTKFEFGRDRETGIINLADEVLTSDSSRYWDAESYTVGEREQSFDKQIVRNYLDGLDWNKQPPGPKLPADITAKTGAAYVTAYEKLTEKKFN